MGFGRATHADYLHERIPHARLLVVDGGTHHLHKHSTTDGLFNDAVEDFLTEADDSEQASREFVAVPRPSKMSK